MDKAFYVMTKATSTSPRGWAVCQCGLLMLAEEKGVCFNDEGIPIGTSFTKATAEHIAHLIKAAELRHVCVCHFNNCNIEIDIEL